MPAKGLVDEKYRGMDSAQVFNLLPDDDGKGGGGGGIDDHDWDGAQEMDGEEVKQLARDIDQAVRQGALLAGKTGSGGDRSLQELLQPKVDWREALREFISSTCTGNDFSTWRRPNRRFVSMGYYMPSGISEQVGTLAIGIDTSGSIGDRELSRFLGEVKGICDTVKPECIRLLYWDTKVCRDEKYVGDEVQNLTSSTKPAGGGGTSVRCVYEYLQKHAVKAQAVVMLTDGYVGSDWGTAQQWGAPVLWCIVGNKSAQPTVGKRVLVDD
jgi:predicted metal-dependent peptidase